MPYVPFLDVFQMPDEINQHRPQDHVLSQAQLSSLVETHMYHIIERLYHQKFVSLFFMFFHTQSQILSEAFEILLILFSVFFKNDLLLFVTQTI